MGLHLSQLSLTAYLLLFCALQGRTVCCRYLWSQLQQNVENSNGK